MQRAVLLLLLTACVHQPTSDLDRLPDAEVPEPHIRVVPPRAELAKDTQTVEVDVENIGTSSDVKAPPQREPIPGFNVCGKGCSRDPRWTSEGQPLPEG